MQRTVMSTVIDVHFRGLVRSVPVYEMEEGARRAEGPSYVGSVVAMHEIEKAFGLYDLPDDFVVIREPRETEYPQIHVGRHRHARTTRGGRLCGFLCFPAPETCLAVRIVAPPKPVRFYFKLEREEYSITLDLIECSVGEAKSRIVAGCKEWRNREMFLNRESQGSFS